MLDLHDPQTQHIFRAAIVEDEIRAHLVAIRQGGDRTERASRYQDIVSRIIPELRRLNDGHFNASRGITKLLDDLESSVAQQDLDLCWKRFYALAESPGDNFGTWTI